MLSTAAQADTWTLTNDNGGDGYVVTYGGNPAAFVLYGADNGVGANYTYYTAVASSAEIVTFDEARYHTYDCCGAYWDPAGTYLNGLLTQLSPASSVPGFTGWYGPITFNLNAGDTYGFYVYSVDSVLGRGEISTVPEASTWAMMLIGFAGLGAAGYRGLRAQADA